MAALCSSHSSSPWLYAALVALLDEYKQSYLMNLLPVAKWVQKVYVYVSYPPPSTSSDLSEAFAGNKAIVLGSFPLLYITYIEI